MTYFIRPRRVHVVQKLSAGDYSDKLLLIVLLHRANQTASKDDASSFFCLKQAYLGVRGSGETVELTDDIWGIDSSGWQIELPEGPSIGQLALTVQVLNVRGVPDERIKAWIELMGTVASAMAAAAGVSIAALGAMLASVGLSDLVADIPDEIFKALGFRPECHGALLSESMNVTPSVLDATTTFVPGGMGASPPESVATASLIMSQSTPLPKLDGCGNGAATLELELERRTPVTLFPPGSKQTTSVRGIDVRRPDGFLGRWVDEPDVYGGAARPSIDVRIARSSENLATVDLQVTEADPSGGVLLTEQFSNIPLQWVTVSLPRDTALLPHKRPASSLPAKPPVEVWNPKGQGLPKTTLHSTAMRLREGDYGRMTVAVFKRSMFDGSGQLLREDVCLYYSRSGYDDLTDAGVWLAPPAKFG